MAVSYVGSLTLGQCIPIALTANAHLSASAGAARDDIQARIAGLGALLLQPPPSVAQLIASVQQTLMALQTMLAAPPIPDVTATAAALAELQAGLASLAGALAFQADFAATLGTAGIRLYTYAGQAGELGAQLGAQLGVGLPGGSGPNESIAGFVLLANDAGAIAALRAVFGG